jgi:hypothetical protein
MTPAEINVLAIQEAKRISDDLGIPWQWIYGQWAYESYSNDQPFGSGLATGNLNLAGIKRFYKDPVTGGSAWEWRSYTSVKDFADDYAGIIKAEYPSVPQARSVGEFSYALTEHKGGGSWYGASDSESIERYASGIKARMQRFLSGEEYLDKLPLTGSTSAPTSFKAKAQSLMMDWWSSEKYIDTETGQPLRTGTSYGGRNEKDPETVTDYLDIAGTVLKRSGLVILGLVLLILGFMMLIKTPPDPDQAAQLIELKEGE